MSELRVPPRRRRRRADAERSITAILDAAIRVLTERPGASMDDVAEAAGVSRQTIYAHFPSREALLHAVIDQITSEALAAIDAADLDAGPAADAVLRFLDAAWQTFERFPLLLQPDAVPAQPEADDDRHQPVLERLTRLVRRGQESGEFDTLLPVPWLLAATIALGHTAGEQAAAGALPIATIIAALKRSVLRLYGAETA